MGRGDNRRTAKMLRRRGQKRRKEQQRRLRATVTARTVVAPKTAPTKSARSGKVAIKRGGQRKAAAT